MLDYTSYTGLNLLVEIVEKGQSRFNVSYERLESAIRKAGLYDLFNNIPEMVKLSEKYTADDLLNKIEPFL